MWCERFREELVESLREQLVGRLDAGATLEEVQMGLLDPALDLTEDEQVALWLYVWSYVQRLRALA